MYGELSSHLSGSLFPITPYEGLFFNISSKYESYGTIIFGQMRKELVLPGTTLWWSNK